MAKFISSKLAIGDHAPINLVDVQTFEKFEAQRIREDKPGRFQIHFIKHEESAGMQSVFWKYNSKCDRDHDYNQIIEYNTYVLP